MALTIESVTVAGFGSYGESPQTLTLGGRGPLAIVGPNGAGKSTIASKALTWCLFGKAPPERMGSATRALKGRAIVGKGQTKAEAVVRLTSDTGATYEVKRARGRSGSDILAISVNGAEIDDAGQHTIDALIGADYDVWCRTVVRGQGDPWSFSEATDARKREILDVISGAEALEAHHARAKSVRQEREAEARRLSDTIEQLDHALSRFDAAKAQEASDTWDRQHKEKCVRLVAEIKSLETAHTTAARQDSKAGDNSEAHTKLIAAEPAIEWRPYDAAIQAAEEEFNRAFAEHTVRLAETETAASLALGEPCPTCSQPVGMEALTGLTQKQASADQAQEELRAAGRYRDDCRQSKQGAQEWLEAERAAWRTKLARLKPTAAHAPAALRELQHAQTRLADVQGQTNPHTSRVKAERIQIDRLNRERRLASTQSELTAWALNAARAWEQALGPKGARAHLAEATIKAIETSANRWLAALSDRPIEVEFQTTREVKGKTKDEIKTIVYAAGEPRDLLSFSGGERKRVNLAVDLGVSEACSGGGLAVSLLVLDEEVFSGLDEHGKAAVVQALHDAGISDVVVIDHDPRLSSTLPRTIKVTRNKQGHSIIEELCESE